jgi:Domain of unknown function (DUF4365)
MPDLPPGPYPQGGRPDDLQQQSLLAFRNAMPVDRFLIRDERVDDKGVDLALELKHVDSFLNIRSQVQLKGTDDEQLNVDGSYSRAVTTANLNYLLNGPCPLYVVWIAARNELRFVFARDEARRLHQDNPTWNQQETITLRFIHILGPEEVTGVYERILQEGRMQRGIHETLARSTMTEPVMVSIDPESLISTDPDKIFQFLLNSGLALVTIGYTKEVVSSLALLNASQASNPRILLVAAYAHMSRGEYLTAGGLIARCMLAENALSPLDRHFLQSLRNACQYHYGVIDYPDYLATEKHLAQNAPPEFAIQHELELTRQEHLRTRDRRQRAPIHEKLRAVVSKILADPDASVGFKLRARIAQLYADTFEASTQCSHSLNLLRMRRDMGLPMNTEQVQRCLEQFLRPLAALIEESARILQEARAQEYPLLFAEALTTQAVIVIDRTVTCRFVCVTENQAIPAIPQKTRNDIFSRLSAAAQTFARAGCLELELWAKLWLADWLELAGEVDEAKAIARAGIGPATAMGYQRQLERAQAHLSGNTEYQKTLKELLAKRDMDLVMADEDDETTKRHAAASLEAMDLPATRLPVVERDWLSLRDVARERVHWCRHLALLQDLRHTSSPDTMYARDPARRCCCEKLGHKSNIGHEDWTTIISAFKQAYCNGCADRDPKVPPRQGAS